MNDAEQCGADSQVVLLVTTHAHAAHYIPHVRETLTEFWPGHPPLRFLTDGGIEGPDVIVGSEKAFVPLLAGGLPRIRAEFPSATHVFHMLEDHCPLRRCAVERIDAAMTVALARKLAAVAFVTYDWPWTYTSNELDEYGRLYGLHSIDTIEIGSETFAVVPPTFFRYFQVQPTIWRIEYIQHVLDQALRLGIVDPWRLEALRLPTVEKHYVSKYPWPTVHHGFLVQGKVSEVAIDFADRNAPGGLRRALMKGAICSDNEVIYRFHKIMTRIENLRNRIKKQLRNNDAPT